MIIAFDLDDTLYPERDYVDSGLAAVARLGAEQFALPEQESLDRMRAILRRDGRGRVFDQWLEPHGLASRARVAACVRAYRHHVPRISLEPAVAALLARLGKSPLYIVTDGHKVAQDRKVEALGLRPLVKRVFITHRHGIARAKPSVYCFERIRRIESCGWSEMVYVADNPAKDFVNLNPLGVHTVRVLTGMHRSAVAAAGHEARHVIGNLAELEATLRKIGDGG
jgi:putative hydrolase of the HAD superfamily